MSYHDNQQVQLNIPSVSHLLPHDILYNQANKLTKKLYDTHHLLIHDSSFVDSRSYSYVTILSENILSGIKNPPYPTLWLLEKCVGTKEKKKITHFSLFKKNALVNKKQSKNKLLPLQILFIHITTIKDISRAHVSKQ